MRLSGRPQKDLNSEGAKNYVGKLPVALGIELGQKLFKVGDSPVTKNVLVVEKLEGCARGLIEENHKKYHEAEPKLARPQFTRAAGTNLH